MGLCKEHMGAGGVLSPGRIKLRVCGLCGEVGVLEEVGVGLDLREKGGGPIWERLKRVGTA